MTHEMYNDGLYFKKKARTTISIGERNRCQRFAIISFASSFESFINELIYRELAKRNENKEPLGIRNGGLILEWLKTGVIKNEKKRERAINETSSIKKKLKIISSLYKIKNIANYYEYKRFQRIIRLRNKVVHYSKGNYSSLYGENILHTLNVSDDFLRLLIMRICQELRCLTPNYFLQTEYKSLFDD